MQKWIYDSLISFGQELAEAINNRNNKYYNYIQTSIKSANEQNAWFIPEFSLKQIQNLISLLSAEEIDRILDTYFKKYSFNQPKTVAVVMAGNIPLVGMLDFLHVIISGHRIICKLSSNDAVLLPALTTILFDIEPRLKDFIHFEKNVISAFDAVIATGSNNTAKYFEYYFGKYPHIIRKTRRSVAILNGNEDENTIEKLCDDVFMFFGLGCRNVSKIFVPKNYDWTTFIQKAKKYEFFFYHNKYINNFDYQKAIFILNKLNYIDGGFFIITQNKSIHSPISVVRYEEYTDLSEVENEILQLTDELQCVVASFENKLTNATIGETQNLQLDTFADDINTFEFLKKLSN